MSYETEIGGARALPTRLLRAKSHWRIGTAAAAVLMCISAAVFAAPDDVDAQLAIALDKAGFTGRIDSSFPTMLQGALRRPLNPRLADLGRNLFFDPVHSLGDDNTCPARGATPPTLPLVTPSPSLSACRATWSSENTASGRAISAAPHQW
jgi:hypothetical protein